MHKNYELISKTEKDILDIESGDGWASEDVMQAKYFQWVTLCYPQQRKLVFHVPNGGWRNKVEAIKMQAMGVVPGIPDIVNLSPLFTIELKVKNGVLSSEQKEVKAIYAERGVNHYIVKEDFLQFKSIFAAHLGPY